MRRLLAFLLLLFSLSAFAARPGALDLTLSQGATLGPLVLTLKDSTGTAVDLTGYTVAAEARRSYSDKNELFTLTCTVTDAANGIMTITVTDETTANLPAPASGVWDLYITDSAGAKYRILAGRVNILPSVTD